MGAKNMVIAGDCKNSRVSLTFSGKLYIASSSFGRIFIEKNSVSHYEIIDQESRKSASSAVGRALVGSLLLGGVGLLAGLSAKRKGIYTIAIEFNDGKKCLIEIDEQFYKILIQELF